MEHLVRVTVYNDDGDIYGEYYFSSTDDNATQFDGFFTMLGDLYGEVHMNITHFVEDTY